MLTNTSQLNALFSEINKKETKTDIDFKKFNLEVTDDQGKTALMYALDIINAEIIKELIDAGADVNATYYDGKTVLMYALEVMNAEDTETIERLIGAGANVDAKDYAGKTVLMYAIETMNPKIFEKVINENPYINAKDDAGKTAFEHALEMLAFFEEENNQGENNQEIEEYFDIIKILESKSKLECKKVVKIREALLRKLRPIKELLQKQDTCRKFAINPYGLIQKETFEQIKQLNPTVKVTADDENFYLHSGLFEKLKPHYYWKEKKVTKNEYIIKTFAKENSIDTKAYEEFTFSFDSVGKYIMFSVNHFSAIKISDGQSGKKQVEIFDSIDASQDNMFKTVSGFDADIKVVRRLQQKENQCWGRAFLYLSKGMADVEDNNSNKYMYENYFSKEEFLRTLNEDELKVLIADLCNSVCHQNIKEMKDISEIFEKHESYTQKAPMLDISIMEKLVSYHNSLYENEGDKIQIAYLVNNCWKIRKKISCISNYKHEDLMNLLQAHPGLEGELKDEGFDYHLSEKEHEMVNKILRCDDNENKKPGL